MKLGGKILSINNIQMGRNMMLKEKLEKEKVMHQVLQAPF